MSDPAAQSGPLTRDELLTIWRSAVDPAYGDAFFAAGDGNGLEVYGQIAEGGARVSQAIDTTTQALYVRPWSGQTASPAAGPQKATVTLTISRTGSTNEPLVIGAGLVWFEEQAPEWGDTGTVLIATGRRYSLIADHVFLPGEAGPFAVTVRAERDGWGYNNPLPGTITFIDQPGAGLNNTLGSIEVIDVVGGKTATLIVVDSPDVVVPEHVGQYVVFENGANIGARARAIGYRGPDPAASIGGRLTLELLQCFESAAIAGGPFVVGEGVTVKDGAAVVIGQGRLVAARAGGAGARLGYVLLSGASAPVGGSIVGASSGASSTVSMLTKTTAPVAENETATWRVLDWSVDIGLSITNAASPAGGRLGFLDQIGAERRVFRASGENDASYATRVAQIADTISPNAIRRAVNRVLIAVGSAGCLREVGDPAYFPGLFYDAGGSKDGDGTHGPDPFYADPARMFAYDMDFGVRPSDRFKLYVDSLEMRAFFLVGVPLLQSGENGFFYDGAIGDTFPTPNPYDAPATLHTFFDGDALGGAPTYRAVQNAIAAAKAAGVGFQLYVEAIGCGL